MRFLKLMRVTMVCGGLVAAVMLVSGLTKHPVLCLVQVDGRSMTPTLQPGQELIFARLPWCVGDIILADVAEPELVVKRVTAASPRMVELQGDNRRVSQDYVVPVRAVKAVLLCQTPLSSPLSRAPRQSRVAWRWTRPGRYQAASVQ